MVHKLHFEWQPGAANCGELSESAVASSLLLVAFLDLVLQESISMSLRK